MIRRTFTLEVDSDNPQSLCTDDANALAWEVLHYLTPEQLQHLKLHGIPAIQRKAVIKKTDTLN